MNSGLSKFEVISGSLVDIGRTRTSNQDEVIVCPELGFFAVSDGMGGLKDGGKTSYMIKEVLPGMIEQAKRQLEEQLEKQSNPPLETPAGANDITLTDEEFLEAAQKLISSIVSVLSDSIFESGNEGHAIEFGATLCGVWLMQRHAIFVNIGDSRGYLLKRKGHALVQITKDHNIAALLVESGDLTKEQAKHHHTSSRITRFMGMPHPAIADTYLIPIDPGDAMLFCSDGLHGMLDDDEIYEILRKEDDPQEACKLLIDRSNEAGGKDNISAVCVRIMGRESPKEKLSTAVRRFSLMRLFNSGRPEKKQ